MSFSFTQRRKSDTEGAKKILCAFRFSPRLCEKLKCSYLKMR
jgi:hypothetical protein